MPGDDSDATPLSGVPRVAARPARRDVLSSDVRVRPRFGEALDGTDPDPAGAGAAPASDDEALDGTDPDPAG